MSNAQAQSREEFLAGRMVELEDGRRIPGIGSSDIAAIMGRDRFRGPIDVYRSIVYGASAPETPHMIRGRKIEPHAAREYVTFHDDGRSVRRMRTIHHPEHPFLLSSTDRRIEGTGRPTPGVLEIKVPSSPVYSKWRREGVDESVLLQSNWQGHLAAYDWGEAWIFSADNWEGFPVPFDVDHELGESMVEAGVRFWNEYVLPQVEPPIEDEDRLEVERLKSTGELEVVGADWDELLSILVDARRERDAAAEEYDVAVGAVKAAMEERGLDALEREGLVRVYYRENKPGTKFDHRSLSQVRPLDRLAVAANVREVLVGNGYLTPEAALAVAETVVARSELDLDAFRKTQSAARPFKPYILSSS